MANYKFGEYIKPAIVEFYTKYNSIVDRCNAVQNAIPTFSMTAYPKGPYSDPNDPRYTLTSTGYPSYEEYTFTKPYSFGRIDSLTKIWIDQFKFGEKKSSNIFAEIPKGFTTVDIQNPKTFFYDAVYRIVKLLCPLFYNHEKKINELSETEWFSTYPNKYSYGSSDWNESGMLWTWKDLCEKHNIPLRADFNQGDYYPDYFPFNWPISYHVLANKLIEMLDDFQYLIVYGECPFIITDVLTGKAISGKNSGETIWLDDSGSRFIYKDTIYYNDDFWDIYNRNFERNKKSEIQSGVLEQGDQEAYIEAQQNFLRYYDNILLSVYNTPFVKEYEISATQVACIPGRYGFYDVRSSASHYYIPEQADRYMSKENKRIYNFSGRSYTGSYIIEVYKQDRESGNVVSDTETYETKNITIPATGYVEPFNEEPEECPPFRIDENATWFSNSYSKEKSGDLYYESRYDPNDADYFLSIQKI